MSKITHFIVCQYCWRSELLLLLLLLVVCEMLKHTLKRSRDEGGGGGVCVRLRKGGSVSSVYLKKRGRRLSVYPKIGENVGGRRATLSWPNSAVS